MTEFKHPKVTLINHTPFAIDMLLLAKMTRLSMSPSMFDEIKAWSPEKKATELKYSLGTIRSAWEHVNFSFLIQDVSRSLMAQATRTRTCSFSVQSQRTVVISDMQYCLPLEWEDHQEQYSEQIAFYEDLLKSEYEGYFKLIEMGVPTQDARQTLPHANCTNLLMTINLRSLSEFLSHRLCCRAQREIQLMARSMRNAVLEIFPEFETVLRVECAQKGICSFENYHDCPVKQAGVYDPNQGMGFNGFEKTADPKKPLQFYRTDPLTKDQIQEVWEHTTHEAIPEMQRK
jgi:thymidylate synthase (FAD)